MPFRLFKFPAFLEILQYLNAIAITPMLLRNVSD